MNESPNMYFAVALARQIAPKSYGTTKRLDLLDRILLSLDAAYERGQISVKPKQP